MTNYNQPTACPHGCIDIVIVRTCPVHGEKPQTNDEPKPVPPPPPREQPSDALVL